MDKVKKYHDAFWIPMLLWFLLLLFLWWTFHYQSCCI